MSTASIVANNPLAGPLMDANQQFPAECSHCGGSDLRSQIIRSAFWDNDRLVVIIQSREAYQNTTGAADWSGGQRFACSRRTC